MILPLPERITDWIATHPSSLPGRVAALRHGLPRATDRREIARAPNTSVRVLIAPAGYAGQSSRWARALEASDPAIGARALAVESRFDFPADAGVSPRVFQNSRSWQREQLAQTRGFTHLLIESLIPPFGRLGGRDLRAQLAMLGEGTDTAFVCHGTDIRSPLGDPSTSPSVRQAVRLAARNRELLAQLDRPVFVTTPDLLTDVPHATWLPVSIDTSVWDAASREPIERPRVVHVPSDSGMKGSALIARTVRELDGRRVIDYHEAAGVRHADMPSIIGAADIVLDQFVLGSYGVAACEAMSAGAVVVGHVTAEVRARVRESTGSDLPIVEASPESLGRVLTELAADPIRRAEVAAASRAFVASAHDGRLSARQLSQHWIHNPSGRNLH